MNRDFRPPGSNRVEPIIFPGDFVRARSICAGIRVRLTFALLAGVHVLLFSAATVVVMFINVGLCQLCTRWLHCSPSSANCGREIAWQHNPLVLFDEQIAQI